VKKCKSDLVIGFSISLRMNEPAEIASEKKTERKIKKK
jgi:hypothetical protein